MELVDAAVGANTASEQQVLSPLDPEELAALEALLRKILAGLEIRPRSTDRNPVRGGGRRNRRPKDRRQIRPVGRIGRSLPGAGYAAEEEVGV